MALTDSTNSSSTSTSIWKDIERSESYLVCGMSEKAASLASFILEHILKTDSATSGGDADFIDMMESAGMVLVQSLKELGRTSGIVKELKAVYGSVTNIPIQVLVTGVCFQLTDDSYSGLCEFLEEFLGKWSYVEGQSYTLVGAEQNGAYLKGYSGQSVLEIDKYLEVVEIYAVALLGRLLNKTDLAIAWVEKAELPNEKRQDLIRRLRSLHSVKPTISSQSEDTSPHAHKSEANPRMGSNISGAGEKKLGYQPNSVDGRKDALLKLSQKVEPCFWWFRRVNIKFGRARLVISQGNIALLGSFIILFCFILQKKRATFKQSAKKHVLWIKKALVDMWQLAFSVQVNPLAAIQPLPTAAHGNRG